MNFRTDDITILTKIAEALGTDSGAWLVGGTLRDAVMARPVRDVDIVVKDDPLKAAGRIAEALGGTYFVMDVERGIYRAVSRGLDLHVDVSRISGDIRTDLSGRDFTMNAMALPLDGLDGEVLDLHGGAEDIGTGTVRALGRGTLTDDPLRLLRAFRFEATLGFTVEPGTLGWISELAAEVRGVSAERVRDELYLILESGRAYETFERMRTYGLLDHIIPELGDMRGLSQPDPHVHNLYEHSMRTMYHALRILGDPAANFGGHTEELASRMNAPAEPPLTMRGLTLLCALLHDAGKPSAMKEENGRVRFIGHDKTGAELASGIADRLKMSRRARDFLFKTVENHMRPLLLSAREKVTGRAKYRLIRDAGEAFYGLMVVALADAYATRERPDAQVTDVEGLVRGLMDYNEEVYAPAKASPLITGWDLIDELGLKPGPDFGRILEHVEEARAEGIIYDRESAIKYVRDYLDKG